MRRRVTADKNEVSCVTSFKGLDENDETKWRPRDAIAMLTKHHMMMKLAKAPDFVTTLQPDISISCTGKNYENSVWSNGIYAAVN